MVRSAKESMKQRASESEIYEKMQEVFVDLDDGGRAVISGRPFCCCSSLLLRGDSLSLSL